MNDLIRWAAQDVGRCEAGIARNAELVQHYEEEASKVAFDPAVQSLMLGWAEHHRAAVADGRQYLEVLKARLRHVGG